MLQYDAKRNSTVATYLPRKKIAGSLKILSKQTKQLSCGKKLRISLIFSNLLYFKLPLNVGLQPATIKTPLQALYPHNSFLFRKFPSELLIQHLSISLILLTQVFLYLILPFKNQINFIILTNKKKELGKHILRLFNKNIACRYFITGTSCPVTQRVQRPRYPDRAKVA